MAEDYWGNGYWGTGYWASGYWGQGGTTPIAPPTITSPGYIARKKPKRFPETTEDYGLLVTLIGSLRRHRNANHNRS